MLESEPTSLQQLEHIRHKERRQRIANHAINDRPLEIHRTTGITGYQAQINALRAALEAERAKRIELAEKLRETEAVKPFRDWLSVGSFFIRNDYPPKFINRIKKIVANYFDININVLYSHQRTSYLIIPRHIAIYLAKMLTGKSLPQIGRAFGDRDHTTILFSVQKTEQRMRADSHLCQIVVELQDRLEQDLALWRANV